MPRYVEANPALVENEPDDTINEAARSQQAAQEDPDPASDSEFPSVDGEEADSQKIVDGSMEQPNSQSLPPGIYTMDQGTGVGPKTAEDGVPMIAPLPALPPAPDFIKQEAVSEDGPGSTLQEIGPADEKQEQSSLKIIQLIRGKQIEVVEEEASEEQIMEAARRGVPIPQPRPTLQFQVPPGPRMTQAVRASRVGTVGVDANYSEFGEYNQRLVEAVSSQWNLFARRTNLADGNIGTKVEIKFVLDHKGYIHDLEVIRTTATRAGTNICHDAIASRAPYGDWTEKMVAIHGKQLPITFTFFYR